MKRWSSYWDPSRDICCPPRHIIDRLKGIDGQLGDTDKFNPLIWALGCHVHRDLSRTDWIWRIEDTLPRLRSIWGFVRSRERLEPFDLKKLWIQRPVGGFMIGDAWAHDLPDISLRPQIEGGTFSSLQSSSRYAKWSIRQDSPHSLVFTVLSCFFESLPHKSMSEAYRSMCCWSFLFLQ